MKYSLLLLLSLCSFASDLKKIYKKSHNFVMPKCALSGDNFFKNNEELLKVIHTLLYVHEYKNIRIRKLENNDALLTIREKLQGNEFTKKFLIPHSLFPNELYENYCLIKELKKEEPDLGILILPRACLLTLAYYYKDRPQINLRQFFIHEILECQELPIGFFIEANLFEVEYESFEGEIDELMEKVNNFIHFIKDSEEITIIDFDLPLNEWLKL